MGETVYWALSYEAKAVVGVVEDELNFAIEEK